MRCVISRSPFDAPASLCSATTFTNSPMMAKLQNETFWFGYCEACVLFGVGVWITTERGISEEQQRLSEIGGRDL